MKKHIYIFLLTIILVSCSDIIEVPDISNDAVNLVAPTDNATLNLTTLTLSWDPIEDAESYQVQIAQPNFSDILQLVKDSTVTGNSFSVDLEAGTTYEWRVRALNSGYTTSYTTYSFTLE